MILLLSLISFAITLVFADVEFTSPSAGADVPVGTIEVRWKDSGRAPAIADLTQYTLALMVGGNDVDNMLPVATFQSGGNYNDGNEVNGTISAGITGSVDNGFFFKMTSTSSSGGQVINYSDRFTITGLTGTLDATYRNAVVELDGNTSGPARSGNGLPAVASSSSAVSTTTSTPQTVTVTSQPTAPSSIPPTGSDNHSGPSTGVIAGVAVVCIAVVVVIIGLGIWALVRRKRRRAGSARLEDKDEFGKQPAVSVTNLSELSADGKVVEIGDGMPPPEMDSNQVRVELEGDSVYGSREALESPVGTFNPLTPIAPSIRSVDTLCTPTSPSSVL